MKNARDITGMLSILEDRYSKGPIRCISAEFLNGEKKVYLGDCRRGKDFGTITLSDCNEEIERNPSAKSYFLRGMVHYHSQNYHSAIKDFDEVIARDKEMPIHFCKVKSYFRLKDVDGLIKSINDQIYRDIDELLEEKDEEEFKALDEALSQPFTTLFQLYGMKGLHEKQRELIKDVYHYLDKDVFLKLAEDYGNTVNRLERTKLELEEMMAMFAHKFRGPLDTIIYNTKHGNSVKASVEAAETMRGLLDIFSIISTDSDYLREKIAADNMGEGRILTILTKTLDMTLLHLLSPSSTGKIRQHYLAYAKENDLCSSEISRKEWREEKYKLEQSLQSQWETEYAEIATKADTLETRLKWVKKHFFELQVLDFFTDKIQFRQYGEKESFLIIILSEILTNTFKYYSSIEKKPVVLRWNGSDSNQILTCQNPSTRSERLASKGSGRGHSFLSALADKTMSSFSTEINNDNFKVEFSIPNTLMLG